MKTLIAYYSQSGQTRRMAQMLADKLGADLHEITPARRYDDDMWRAWDEAQAERNADSYPDLAGGLPDASGYDMVLLGTGIWGHTMSNPMTSFVRRMDLSGKRVSAFWTFYDHDERADDDFRSCLEGASYVKGLPLPRSLTASERRTSDAMDRWIQTL